MYCLRLVQQPEHQSAGSAGFASLLFVFQAGLLLIPFSALFPPSATRTRTSCVLIHPGVLSQKFLTIRPPIHPVSLRSPRSPTLRRSPALRRLASRATQRSNSGNLFPGQNTACLHDTTSVLPGIFQSGRSRFVPVRIRACRNAPRFCTCVDSRNRVKPIPEPLRVWLRPQRRVSLRTTWHFAGIPAGPQFVHGPGGCSREIRCELRFRHKGEHKCSAR